MSVQHFSTEIIDEETTEDSAALSNTARAEVWCDWVTPESVMRGVQNIPESGVHFEGSLLPWSGATAGVNITFLKLLTFGAFQ